MNSRAAKKIVTPKKSLKTKKRNCDSSEEVRTSVTVRVRVRVK
jgi:hypothetical protein